MSTGFQSGLSADPGNSPALTLLDEKILAMIRGQSPLRWTLDVLCAELEKQYPGMLCSILFLDSDGVTLRNGASPNLPAEYSAAVDGVKIGPCAGSCGTAIYRKCQVIVCDSATDPLWADCRQVALPHGLRACWSTPIPSQHGGMLGTFAIYYRHPGEPNAEQLQVITHVTHLVALAIERDRDKSELRAAEDRYRTLVERLPAITYIAELGAEGAWHY